MSRSNESTPEGRRIPGDLGRRGHPSGRRTHPENDNPYEGSTWMGSTQHQRAEETDDDPET